MSSATASYAARALHELPALWDGMARLVRAGMGITAFGANVFELPPDYTTESHDESDTGQQELYVALRGSGWVGIGDARVPLDGEHMVRVDAGIDRVLSSGPEGLRVLCIGGVPGAPMPRPALLTSTSRRPKRSRWAATTRWTSSSTAMLPGTASTSWPAARSSSAAASRFSGRRALTVSA